MMHLQLRVPEERVDEVVSLLVEDEAVTNVAVIPDAYIKPTGCLVVCDVARGGANAGVSRLGRLRIHPDGAIMMTGPEAGLSDSAPQGVGGGPGRPLAGLA